ncbi:MAG: hypothetical protein KAJ07_09555 [Planctomycetes bacterium]|nr:hypothetical protein [Planctomycetota bacterium]
MDEDKKQKVMIGMVVGCLVLVAALNIPRFFKGGSKVSVSDTVTLICLNPECGADSEITREEYQESIQNSSMGMGPMQMAGPIECPKCKEISAARGLKCKKCSNVFMLQYGSDDYPDRCPECGYSDIENRRSE